MSADDLPVGPMLADSVADPWGERRLGIVLMHAFEAYGGPHGFDTHVVARRAGVSERTVRRWVQRGLPKSRRPDIESRVLPPAPLVEQEAKELEYARESVARINVPRSRLNDAWVEKGWIKSHVLAVVWMPALKVCLARIAHNDEKSVKRLRQGGVIIERHVFENRFAAQAAKGELLLAVARWRLVLPEDLIARGRTEAWLENAPRPPLESLAGGRQA